MRFDWGYFPDTVPAFPAGLTAAIIHEGKVPGILGNCHAPGTGIIERFGEEHIRTGKPICYTSVDSVLQIAAHETHFGLERLYELCLAVRRLVDPLKIGRVIARPFVGETRATFLRTHNRRDYAVPPPEPVVDALVHIEDPTGEAESSRLQSLRYWAAVAGAAGVIAALTGLLALLPMSMR